jgi:hypothetical protein
VIEVRIGVVDVPKELTLELEDDPKEVVEKVNAALGGETDMLWLTDSRGKQVGIPVAKIAYLEVEPERSRRVGFGAE